eukprot:137686-Pleurochrysis_carterae.AAC.2
MAHTGRGRERGDTECPLFFVVTVRLLGRTSVAPSVDARARTGLHSLRCLTHARTRAPCCRSRPRRGCCCAPRGSARALRVPRACATAAA